MLKALPFLLIISQAWGFAIPNTYVNRFREHSYIPTELCELEIITKIIMMHLTQMR
jgi:hypothetical protein